MGTTREERMLELPEGLGTGRKVSLIGVIGPGTWVGRRVPAAEA